MRTAARETKVELPASFMIQCSPSDSIDHEENQHEHARNRADCGDCLSWRFD
ncbi:hypothetical protein B0G75_11143 [Paraburkholderia sp. BL18I3N2]|nr:hypothetical protein B0G75_11143 [Paraburkholderia sp. BL18I3N2]